MQCNFCLLDLSNSVDSARSKVQHEKYYLLHVLFLVLLLLVYFLVINTITASMGSQGLYATTELSTKLGLLPSLQ